MAKLNNLNIYEAQILKKLCQEKDIQRLLDNGDIEYDCNKLKWDCIRPEVYYPKINDSAKTYICFGISGEVYGGKTEKMLYINFYIFCHDSLLRTDKGKRTTLIATVIDNLFNGTNEIALGEMNLVKFDGNFTATQDYHGYQLTYAVRDFNNITDKGNLTYAK